MKAPADPPFAIGDHVRCTYRKEAKNQREGIVYRLRHVGGAFGWAVWAKGTTAKGKLAYYSWWDHSLVLVSTPVPAKEPGTP
jgi:hypothetical protein